MDFGVTENNWTHSICDLCWNIERPNRTPVRLTWSNRHLATCCFCGMLNVSGIYVRQDPSTTKCEGVHRKGE